MDADQKGREEVRRKIKRQHGTGAKCGRSGNATMSTALLEQSKFRSQFAGLLEQEKSMPHTNQRGGIEQKAMGERQCMFSCNIPWRCHSAFSIWKHWTTQQLEKKTKSSQTSRRVWLPDTEERQWFTNKMQSRRESNQWFPTTDHDGGSEELLSFRRDFPAAHL